jgi:hypothetical protein
MNYGFAVEDISRREIEEALTSGVPTQQLKDFWSGDYCINPMFFNFYYELYEKIVSEAVKYGWISKDDGMERAYAPFFIYKKWKEMFPTTDNLLYEEASLGGNSNKGTTKPVVTETYDLLRKLASDTATVGDMNMGDFNKEMINAYYDVALNQVKSVFNKKLPNRDFQHTTLLPSFTPLQVMFQIFSQYKDFANVKAEYVYRHIKNSNAASVIANDLQNSDRRTLFIFPPLCKRVFTENFQVQASFDYLVNDFAERGWINSQEQSTMLELGQVYKISENESRSNFLKQIYWFTLPQKIDALKALLNIYSRPLSSDELSAIGLFLNLYDSKVCSESKKLLNTAVEMKMLDPKYIPSSNPPVQNPPVEPAQPKVKSQKKIKKNDFVYYQDLLKMPSIQNLKILSARFLTKDEITQYNKEYGTTDIGLELAISSSTVDSQSQYDDFEKIARADILKGKLNYYSPILLGKPLNPELLDMAIAMLKFDSQYYQKYRNSLMVTTGLEEDANRRLESSRLNWGYLSFDDFTFWKPLFPDVSREVWTDTTSSQDIQDEKFPDWYKKYALEVLKQKKINYEAEGKSSAGLIVTVGESVYNVPRLLTGLENKDYIDIVEGFVSLPLAYLMFEIQTEEIITDNSTEITKLKQEYAALQYYLNVEVPLDAFAQRKLLSSVMVDISDKLEQQIEALYYSPSFEPLFEFWAEKQTEGQRAISLQPCMLPTPNGEKSELDLIQYAIVRSEEFKKWFGDWEEAAKTGNYNGVSKAINPLTQEPQVAFHGKANMVLEFSKMAFAMFPVKYFGTNLSYAEWFKINQSKSDRLVKLVYEFFIDLKNPIDLSFIGLTLLTAEDFIEVIRVKYNYDIQSPIFSQGSGDKVKLWRLVRFSEQMLEELKANTYFDGLIMYEDNGQDLTASGYDSSLLGFSPNSYDTVQQVAGTNDGNFTLDYVTFTNFQIKAADGRNTTFFNNVEDFRFAKGGITKKRKK